MSQYIYYVVVSLMNLLFDEKFFKIKKSLFVTINDVVIEFTQT